MKIRRAKLEDIASIESLFFSTVKEVNSKDYSKKQIDVWSSFAKINSWEIIIKNQKVWVAEKNNLIIGFCSLCADGLFNYLYVHHNYQRMRVATALQEVLEKQAKNQNNKIVWARVSITARPFFLCKGYKISKFESFKKDGVIFKNAIMEKQMF
tara:strand:+ start:347 stop:808 length:462 start_codon:yes stop_codon:yes gene_type:complete